MKTITLVLTLMGIIPTNSLEKYLDRFQEFNKSEKRFINNVIELSGKSPYYIYKQDNGKIAMLFDDQKIVLGKDGFIHDLHIKYEDGTWYDLGPEY